jgi:5'-deoxynucleotidase YfbR-like HD superfamily hydrolase
MENMTRLFHVLELTRNQPQTGYMIWGGDVRLGNLAEHHYMVLMIAWQLGHMVQKVGAHIDLLKIFEFAAVHDIGELFGGDISMPYGKINPTAKKYAKMLEAENQRFISRFFGIFSRRFRLLSKEILSAVSDEARIVKIADYIEITHYKFFIGKFVAFDIGLVADKIRQMIEGISDEKARTCLRKFVDSWQKEMPKFSSYPSTIVKIFDHMKTVR